MKLSANKVKLFIVGAIALLALLLITCIGQIIAINIAKKELAIQTQRLNEINSQLDYYRNGGTDPGDIEIIVGGP